MCRMEKRDVGFFQKSGNIIIGLTGKNDTCSLVNITSSSLTCLYVHFGLTVLISQKLFQTSLSSLTSR